MGTADRSARRLTLAVAVLCLSAGASSPALTQETGDGDGVRLGFTFGGISTVGFTVELFQDDRSLDLTFGTWSFRDLSVSVVGKQYLGASDLKPYVGGGLWLVLARPPGERTGFATVLTAPLGVDWRASGRHHVGFALNVNRALWVRRTDPADELPLNRRLVPLPGLYYRWRR